jgi:hypothetical protein
VEILQKVAKQAANPLWIKELKEYYKNVLPHSHMTEIISKKKCGRKGGYYATKSYKSTDISLYEDLNDLKS